MLEGQVEGTGLKRMEAWDWCGHQCPQLLRTPYRGIWECEVGCGCALGMLPRGLGAVPKGGIISGPLSRQSAGSRLCAHT